jgi:hypothetical protein
MRRLFVGFSTSALFVEGAVEDIVAKPRILGSFTGELVRGTDGSNRWQFAVAQLASWVAIIDPDGQLFDESFACSATQRTLWISMRSVVSCYGFIYWIGGRVVRQVIYIDNRPTREIGMPLAEEAGIELPSWGYDEDWIFTMVRRLTGIGWGDLESSRFAVMQPEFPSNPLLQALALALARETPDEPAAREAIFLAFADPDPSVRVTALQAVLALENLTESDLERIDEMGADPDEQVARWSDIVLRNIRRP